MGHKDDTLSKCILNNCTCRHVTGSTHSRKASMHACRQAGTCRHVAGSAHSDRECTQQASRQAGRQAGT